jgi:hypothetical protein
MHQQAGERVDRFAQRRSRHPYVPDVRRAAPWPARVYVMPDRNGSSLSYVLTSKSFRTVDGWATTGTRTTKWSGVM